MARRPLRGGSHAATGLAAALRRRGGERGGRGGRARRSVRRHARALVRASSGWAHRLESQPHRGFAAPNLQQGYRRWRRARARAINRRATGAGGCGGAGCCARRARRPARRHARALVRASSGWAHRLGSQLHRVPAAPNLQQCYRRWRQAKVRAVGCGGAGHCAPRVGGDRACGGGGGGGSGSDGSRQRQLASEQQARQLGWA